MIQFLDRTGSIILLLLGFALIQHVWMEPALRRERNMLVGYLFSGFVIFVVAQVCGLIGSLLSSLLVHGIVTLTLVRRLCEHISSLASSACANKAELCDSTDSLQRNMRLMDTPSVPPDFEL